MLGGLGIGTPIVPKAQEEVLSSHRCEENCLSCEGSSRNCSRCKAGFTQLGTSCITNHTCSNGEHYGVTSELPRRQCKEERVEGGVATQSGSAHL